MKITVDSIGSSSGGCDDDDERGMVGVEGNGGDSDVDMIEMEPEEKEAEQLETTNSLLPGQINWRISDNYTNGRGVAGGHSYRGGSRGGSRMRGVGRARGTYNGQDTNQGYQEGSFSPTHLSSTSSSSGQEDKHQGLSGDNRRNENGGGDGQAKANEFKETLTRLAGNINSGFVYLNTAMKQLREGQLELYDAKSTLERLCWENGVFPEFPAVSMMESSQFCLPVVVRGEGREQRGQSGRARRGRVARSFLRMTTGGKCAKKEIRLEFSSYNSQRSKEGLSKLIKRLDASLYLKGTKKSKRHAVVVLYDVGNGGKMNPGKDPVKMEGDAKMRELEEDNKEEEEEEECRPYRKRSKENLPHWRKLRVDPPVMERIMKRLKEFNSSSAPASQSQTSSDTGHFSSQGVGEVKIREEKIGEEN